MYNELLNLCEKAPNEIYYHFYNGGLCIVQNNLEVTIHNEYVEFKKDGLRVRQWRSDKVDKCRKPDNLIVECEECYRLRDDHDDVMGYIYTKIPETSITPEEQSKLRRVLDESRDDLLNAMKACESQRKP